MKAQGKNITIIGLVGLPGAGKTTAAIYLETKGFKRVTLSSFIKAEASRCGTAIHTREEYQDWGNKMRKEFGPHILAARAMEEVAKEKRTKIVIDGVRNPGEIAYLSFHSNFILIGVVAKTRVRYERILQRKGAKWAGDFSNFLKQERRERELGSDESGQRVTDCLGMTTHIVHNNTSTQDLYRSLDTNLYGSTSSHSH